MPQNFGGEAFLLFNQGIRAILGESLLCLGAAQSPFSLNAELGEHLLDRYFFKVGIGSRCHGLRFFIRHRKFLILTGLTYRFGVLSAFLDEEQRLRIPLLQLSAI